jgi:hypothetical protein
MKRRRYIAALAVLPAISAVVLVLTGPAPQDANAGGASSAGDAGTARYASPRYGLSVTVPAGWHRARARLVPKLLAPREVVSLGNFGMRVGGGGNCGREPAASISRMRAGDALVSLQEVPVFPRLRAHLRRAFPPLPRQFGFADLRRVPGPGGGAEAVRAATLAFSGEGRAFEALVYIAGPATPLLRADVGAILGGLRLRPGSWSRFHGDENPAR